MTLNVAYWVLMLVWLAFGAAVHFGVVGVAWAGASTLLLFILFVLIGWQIFGAPLHK